MQRAARLIRPDIARLPNANTGFRADLPGFENAYVLDVAQ